MIGSRQDESQLSEGLDLALRSEESLGSRVLSTILDGLASGMRRARERRVGLPEKLQGRLFALLDSKNEALRKSALKIAARVRITEGPSVRSAMHRARTIASAEDGDADRRSDAIFLLGLDPKGESLPALGHYLAPEISEAVQAAAARALLASGSPRALKLVFDNWKSCRARVKESILQELFQDRDRLASLLDAIEREQIPRNSLSRARRSQLLRFPIDDIRTRSQKLFEAIPRDPRMSVLARYQDSLRVVGDAARGRALFQEHCARCHRLGDMGHEVGPDLASLAGRTRQDLLAQIIDPNASISPGYEDYLVETNDGRWVTGIVARETGNSVTLRRTGGEEDTLLRSQISNMTASSVSSMPEDFEKTLSIPQMADLLAYLKSFATSAR
jgi:putative heme-binding domain-containing protein